MADQFYVQHLWLKLVVKQKTQTTNLKRNYNYVLSVIKHFVDTRDPSRTTKVKTEVNKWGFQVFGDRHS